MEAAFVKLIIAIIFGLITGGVARDKNRNPWVWGVAGALSLVGALLVLAFMPHKCPACQRSITSDQAKSKVCPSCGSFDSGTGDKALSLTSTPDASAGFARFNAPVQLSDADEEVIYGIAAKEIGSSDMRTGLWAKLFAESDGNEKVAIARYIRVRGQQLKDEHIQHLKVISSLKSDLAESLSKLSVSSESDKEYRDLPWTNKDRDRAMTELINRMKT